MLIVQRNTYTPEALTVAVVLFTLALPKVTVPGPLTLLQVPLPMTGALPASVTTSPHTFWFTPALAAVGAMS